MIDLWFIRYDGMKGRRYLHIINLGEHGNKVVGLDSTKVPDHEANIMRVHLDTLDKLSLEEKVRWLKQCCPASMAGYRALDKSRVHTLNTFAIEKLQPQT